MKVCIISVSFLVEPSHSCIIVLEYFIKEILLVMSLTCFLLPIFQMRLYSDVHMLCTHGRLCFLFGYKMNVIRQYTTDVVCKQLSNHYLLLSTLQYVKLISFCVADVRYIFFLTGNHQLLKHKLLKHQLLMEEVEEEEEVVQRNYKLLSKKCKRFMAK